MNFPCERAMKLSSCEASVSVPDCSGRFWSLKYIGIPRHAMFIFLPRLGLPSLRVHVD
jgi:hypothetical protein